MSEDDFLGSAVLWMEWYFFSFLVSKPWAAIIEAEKDPCSNPKALRGLIGGTIWQPFSLDSLD